MCEVWKKSGGGYGFQTTETKSEINYVRIRDEYILAAI